MSHSFSRALVALALVVVPLGGCSHDDDHHDHARADTTSGDEHDHDRVQVATRDTDHDGHDDAVAVHDRDQTVLDQGESASDVEITRQIRAAVVEDSSLSFGARNCVIITNGGHVTLRGDVTAAENVAIERHATEAAGVLHVDNQLNVTDAGDAP